MFEKFKIIKKSAKVFEHLYFGGSKGVVISSFSVIFDYVGNTFVIVLRNGANIPQAILNVSDIIVIDETSGSIEETFLTAEALHNRLEQLNYTGLQSEGGVTELSQLTDVDVTGLTNGQVLVWNSTTNLWTATTIGGLTTPTLKEVTTAGNETTDEVIFRANADIFIKIDSITGFIEFWDLSIDAVNPISIINKNYINISDGATSKFEYNPYTNTLVIEDNLFAYVINSNGNIEILDKTTEKSLFVQVPTSITDTRVQTYQDASGTIALTSDITADNADALKRNGSNANSDVDLGAFRIKANEIVTQLGGNPTKSMTLKGNNLSGEHTAEWQDIDYTGIADISQVPTSLSQLSTDSENQRVSSTEKDTYAGKQDALGFTPEKSVNKSTSTSDSASTTKFPVWSAIVSYFSASQIRSILGITTLSGSNTGDQDLSGLATKSMGAYSFRVNNTNTTANSTEKTYKSLGKQTYSLSPTWTGTTAPTTPNHSYSIQILDNFCKGSIWLYYGTAGSSLTQVVIPFTSDMPNPVNPNGLTNALDVIGYVTATMRGTNSATLVLLINGFIRINSAGTGYEFVVVGNSAGYKNVLINFEYPIS